MRHIELTPAQRALIRRTVDLSELELRFGYLDEAGERHTGVPEPVFGAIVGRLSRRGRAETVGYTNTMWAVPNNPSATYRRTVGLSPEEIFVMKTRRQQDFMVDFSWFSLKCSEAVESRMIAIPEARGREMTRRIQRTKIAVRVDGVDLVYECSVVVTGEGKKTYEVELELPGVANEKLADIAVSGVSFLLDAFYETYHPPPFFFVPQKKEMDRVISRVGMMTTGRNPFGNHSGIDPYQFHFRSKQPTNLKREQLGALDEFAMTNKLDGERKIVVSDASGIWVFHPNGFLRGKLDSCYQLFGRCDLPFFVLDAEYYHGRFHVFDVVQWGDDKPNALVRVDGHERRMADLGPLADLERYLLTKKKFYYGSFPENISAFMAENEPNAWYDHNDGLIFTSKSGTWTTASHFKYKFPSKMSIDFKLMPSGQRDGHNFYRLGVAKWDKGRATIVPFAPGNKTQELFTFGNHGEAIAECIFDGRWSILRLRGDKVFPNADHVALDVYADIALPIRFSELIGGRSVYESAIAEREDAFRYESARKSQRLIFTGYDVMTKHLGPILLSFYAREANDNRWLEQTLIEGYEDKNFRDFDLLNALLESSSQYPWYNRTYEVRPITDILSTQGVKTVFDARRQTVVDVRTIGEGEGWSYRLPLSRRIVDLPRVEHPLSVLRFPELQSILTAWFPEGKIAVMKAHDDLDTAAWRSWFPSVAAFENERRIDGARYEDAVFDAQYWGENVFEGVFLSAVPRRDTRELYLHDTELRPIGGRNLHCIATMLLQRRSCRSVAALVPENYPIETLAPAMHVEVQELKGARILRLRAARPATALTDCDVSLWSIPYVDQYARLFTLTSAQQEVFVRVPVDKIREMMVSAQMNYHYAPFSVLPWKLIHAESLATAAAEHGYREIGGWDTGQGWHMLHFSKRAAKQVRFQPPAPVQPPRHQAQISRQAPSQAQPSRLPRPAARPVERPADKGEEDRSPMRKYHNLEKGKLIRMYCRQARVLDLGAGYGGDLYKYSEAGVRSLVLVEPSEENINSRGETEGLLTRLETHVLRDHSKIVHAVGQDTEKILREAIIPDGRVGIAASFFSMTFLFESSEILGKFLDTVDLSLEEGGYFIGTMMEGEKTFSALLGMEKTGTRTYGKATIVKGYDDSDPQGFGMPLWINIDGTIVKKQNEYLAFFSMLRAEMEKREFVLEWKFDFKPETHFKPIDAVDQDFSRLNIGFAFRKMPRRIPNPVDLLRPGVSHEFINLYGDRQVLIRTGVDADRSLLRSYLYQTSSKYRQNKNRNELVDALAQRVDATAQGLMEALDVNVYLIDAETRRPVRAAGYRVSRRASVVILRKGERYEPIGFLSNGYANRILRPFDANLVKLHHAMNEI